MAFAGRRATPVIVAALAALLVGILGASITDIGPWYLSLRFPDWKPPDWLFGPAWTLIFACAALSGTLGWRHAPDRATRERIVALFGVNALLNLLWSTLFFRLHRPDWAFYEMFALWLSILVLIFALRRISTAAAVLLVPYIAWVTFAGILNRAIVQLNAPF